MSLSEKTIEHANGLSARERFHRSILAATRAYTFNTPISKGKYRLFQTVLGMIADAPTRVDAVAADGRRFVADLTTGMQETLYFLGEYEPFLTEVFRSMIRPGDICIDAGANFGWYTTLMASIVGSRGEVHAFEPIPMTFELLSANRDLSDNADAIRIARCALGDHAGELVINLFADMPTGHASAGVHASSGIEPIKCELTTLDQYAQANGLTKIDVMKADVEGSELMMLAGAGSIMSASPPVILMEMALEQTRVFGYSPDDLLNRLREFASYRFYRADELNKKLIEIYNFEPDDIGANVFCVPADRSEDLSAHLKRYIQEQ